MPRDARVTQHFQQLGFSACALLESQIEKTRSKEVNVRTWMVGNEYLWRAREVGGREKTDGLGIIFSCHEQNGW